MPEIKYFNAVDSRDEMLASLKRDGAIIVEDAVDELFIDSLRKETDPYMKLSRPGHDEFSGKYTTRTGGLVSRSSKCRDLIQNQLILDMCDGLLLEHCGRYQLHLTQIIRVKPKETKQLIHKDKWAWGNDLNHLEPQLNTIWALSEFTNENGATRVAPGSSNWDDKREISEEEIVQAEMKLGSVLIYTGSVFHGAGSNESDADRIGLNITYTLGWLRQEENQYLSTPPEVAKDLDPKLLKLIGYSMGNYSLGYYTPPGDPGELPEVVPPQYAVGLKESPSFSYVNYEEKESE
jgi:ectoine hydroxylase-related dioxygenase (phytanoyl-CoA dioxygenase family)